MLAQVLKQYRWATKITVRDLAKTLGISAATLSRIESGEGMDGKTLTKILIWLLEEQNK